MKMELEEVSELLCCNKSTLHRWIQRYFEADEIIRKNYKPRKERFNKNYIKLYCFVK